MQLRETSAQEFPLKNYVSTPAIPKLQFTRLSYQSNFKQQKYGGLELPQIFLSSLLIISRLIETENENETKLAKYKSKVK